MRSRGCRLGIEGAFGSGSSAWIFPKRRSYRFGAECWISRPGEPLYVAELAPDLQVRLWSAEACMLHILHFSKHRFRLGDSGIVT
jgi:hypothetical protein